MPQFLTPLIVELNRDENTWTLSAPLIYTTDIAVEGHYVIAVPKGFVTDLASVPRLPLAYLMAGGMANKAAVVHDYLYSSGIGTKAIADRVFLEAMQASGIAAWRRYLMYVAVRIGGKGSFDKKEAPSDVGGAG